MTWKSEDAKHPYRPDGDLRGREEGTLMREDSNETEEVQVPEYWQRADKLTILCQKIKRLELITSQPCYHANEQGRKMNQP